MYGSVHYHSAAQRSAAHGQGVVSSILTIMAETTPLLTETGEETAVTVGVVCDRCNLQRAQGGIA